MKLNFDFSALKKVADGIGAADINIQLDDIQPFNPIDVKLSTTGIEVELNKIELIDGVFAYQGRHVVLYIADHSFRIEDAIYDKNRRNKFHITDCKTLQEKKRNNTFERYVATNKIRWPF